MSLYILRALSIAVALLLAAPALAYEGVKEQPPPAPPPKPPVLTKAPAIVHQVEAEYPPEAKKEGLTGSVTMNVDIDESGAVTNVEVTKPAGHGFDEAATAAVYQYVFSPAELDGVPGAVRIEYTYHFAFKEVPVGPASAPADLPPPVTLKGQLVERASRSPIGGAAVTCENFPEDVVTDTDGRFELHPPPGTCHLVIKAPNHLAEPRDEQIAAGQVLEVTYHLMPRSYGLYQTVVRGAREKREAVRRTMEREELQKVPGSFGDPIRAVQNLPGIARMPFGLGQMIVRGAAPQETGNYMDGVQIPLLFHFLGGPSVVNPEFLDRIDFFPGGFGPRYGRAIGGVLDAGTRRGDEERLHGSLKIDLIDTAGFVEAPLGKDTTIAVAARRSYVDALMPTVMQIIGRDGISILPRYWDYQVRADHGKKGDANTFTLMAFGSDDVLTVAASGAQVAREISVGAHTGFHRLRGAYNFKSGGFTNSIGPFLGFDQTGIEVEGGPTGGSFTYVGGVRDEASWELGGGNVLRVGADVAAQRADFSVTVSPPPNYRTFPGERPLVPQELLERKIESIDFGFYTELTLRPVDGLTLIPGVRLDRWRLHGRDRGSADPRLTARLQLAEPTALKGSIGHYTQAPDAAQFDPRFGNPDLGLPHAFQSSLGVEHKFTDVINLEVVGFYNRRYDRPVFSSRLIANADGTYRPEIFNNDGLGRAYGVEIMLRHEITEHFFGWVAYTLSRTEERRRGGEYLLGGFDQPHILTMVGQYKIGNGWELGGRFRLVSGRPDTPAIDATFDADTGGFRRINGETQSERLQTFHQLDLRVDKTWLYDYWKLGVYLDVQNVYWAENIEFSGYDYRFKQRDDIPGIPILPTLGVKGSF